MLNKIKLGALLVASTSHVNAQNPGALSITGSADTYYKYDFAKTPNIQTSFGTDHNSVSIGMLDLVLKKEVGKTSFVGELAFGPRGQYQSTPNGDGTDVNSFNIQNLYATYAFSSRVSLTAGYMSTFIGYEAISPLANFNYSTSYLFTNGPFQNAGIKTSIRFSEKVSLMLGLFNDQWNAYKATPSLGVSSVGTQLSLTLSDGWNTNFNALSSRHGTEFDITTSYQITKDLKMGLNLADYKAPMKGGFSGAALYVQYNILGIRIENFKSKVSSGYSFIADNESVFALTLSGNIKSGGLTFIPELRFDDGSTLMFKKSSGLATRYASQATLAIVYSF